MLLELSASADDWAGDLGKPGVKGSGPLGLLVPSRGAALASEACVGAAKATCTHMGVPETTSRLQHVCDFGAPLKAHAATLELHA